MPKKKIKDSFSHKLLKIIALSGTIAIATTSPYFGIRGSAILRQTLNRKKWWEFKKAINALKRKRRINVEQNPDGTFTLEITQIGENIIKKYDIENLTIKSPEQWDGGWRIISFDIPKKKQEARHVLLQKLKNLGFIMIQKSVWAHPFECKSELSVIAKAYEVEPYVYLFEAWGFDNDKAYGLRRKFEIKNNTRLL